MRLFGKSQLSQNNATSSVLVSELGTNSAQFTCLVFFNTTARLYPTLRRLRPHLKLTTQRTTHSGSHLKSLLNTATVSQKGLAEIEAKLRTAQCQDALEGVRNVLKMKTRMIAFKNQNIHGQRQGTRSRAVIDQVHERARNTAEKYRASRAAKLELEGRGVWEETLRELKDQDVRGYQDPNRLHI